MDLNQTQGLSLRPVAFHSFLSLESGVLWTQTDHTQTALAAWYSDAIEVEEERLKTKGLLSTVTLF